VVTSAQSEPTNPSPIQLIDRDLQVDASLLPAFVEVYSMEGQLIQSEQISERKFGLMKYLNKGVYIIRVSSLNGNSASLKVGLGW
jgi:hypothetical protein